MKRILVAAALLVFLSSCTQAPAPAPTATATMQPTVTFTPPPTATATNIAPSMENVPAEWADKIDRIEAMTGMDGAERTVAIQRPDDPDKESKLRALQWDAAAKEWVAYEPQVGKYGWGSWWDRVQIDDLPVGELLARMNREVIYGKGGQEIMPGLVADLSDYTILCGDIVDFDFHETNGDHLTNTNLVVAVPLPSGDVTLLYISGSSPDRPSSLPVGVFRLESVDPSALWADRMVVGSQSSGDVFERFPRLLSTQAYWRHLTEQVNNDPYRRIVLGVDKMSEENRDSMRRFVTWETIDSELIRFILDNATFMSAEEYDSI